MSYNSIVIIGYTVTSVFDPELEKSTPVDPEGVLPLAEFDIQGDISSWFDKRNKEYFFTLCGIHHSDNRIMIDDYDQDIGVLFPEEFKEKAEEMLQSNPKFGNLKICLDVVNHFHDIYGDDLIILHYGS